MAQSRDELIDRIASGLIKDLLDVGGVSILRDETDSTPQPDDIEVEIKYARVLKSRHALQQFHAATVPLLMRIDGSDVAKH